MFQTEALAAFDGSEQGARRLAAAIDATTIEALRRAGTSVQELQTGFTKTSSSAINDLDIVAESLKTLGVTGADAGRVLETSIGKALDTAATTRAVDAVRERIEALGAAGLLSGAQVADGLQKARDKIDSLLPGINSLSEALHTFGLQAVEQSAALATKLGDAYAVVAQSAKVSLADQRTAFDEWSKAATAANAGVEPSAVHLAGTILQIKESALTAGTGIESAMGRAKQSAVDAANAIAAATAQSLSSSFEAANAQTKADSNASNAARKAENSVPIDDSVRQDLVNRKASGTLTAADLAAAQSNLQAQKNNYTLAETSAPGMFSLEGQQDALTQYRLAQQILDQVTQLAKKTVTPSSASTSTSHTVSISLNGQTTTVNTASASDATSLATLLKTLESSARSAGY